MALFQILYWHDIPLQVRAGERRQRISQPLPDRFQLAVDNAAMAAGVSGSDPYLAGFRWSDWQERAGEPAAVVTAVIAELAAAYPTIDWRRTAQAIRGDRPASP